MVQSPVMDQDRGDVRGPIIVPRMDRSGMDRDRSSRPKANGRRRGQAGERPRHHGGRPGRVKKLSVFTKYHNHKTFYHLIE